MSTELVAAERIRATETGLVLPDDLTREEWEDTGHALGRIDRGLQWCIGDWLNAGHDHGYIPRERYDEAMGFVELKRATLHNYAWVAGEIESSFRNEDLTFQHHLIAASRDGDRDELLTWAAEERIRDDKPDAEPRVATVRELRAEIKRRNRQETPPLPAGEFAVIVADPPWAYDEGWPEFADEAGDNHNRLDLPYQDMSLDEIKALDVLDHTHENAHLFLWTTNRYLRDSFDVAESWGFKPSQVLTWCKPPRGIGPGGIFSNTSEFILYARRGRPSHEKRTDSSWWEWPRGRHSEKPVEFLDLVETICTGPYLEMFARQERDGWESWGLEA